MTLSNDEKKHLRRLGHNLKPIVTVAGNGLNENVIAELDRALDDHELIKVKLAVGDRSAKAQIINAICEQLNALNVQTIGHMLLLLRRAKKPNPKLSNLLR
ncbi:MAG: ribosome assembly RNA-binding protein YhbY [Porticoccaceae bacterium]|nr:ribosome assembly RNA-binding protein YhbY [Pseudomonadales bacterium]MCP5172426.1 ribosome assembly RNA-binding protein YhbY [Pseudomonadales bacterium]